MSDRIAVMNRGIVEQVAGPEDVYERPATTFVAGFIGVSNLMPGTVALAERRSRRRSSSRPASRSRPTRNGLSTGERCHAVVRPEKLDVDARGNGAAPVDDRAQSVEGTVASSVYLGTATQLVGRARAAASRMTVLVPERRRGASAQRFPAAAPDVSLSWTPEHIHLVRESGAERATADHQAIGMRAPGGERLRDGRTKPPAPASSRAARG